MRRKEREILDKGIIEDILNKEYLCRIGLVDAGRPYVVPMVYGYKDHALWMHSAKTGRKAELIKANKEVCFEIESQLKLLPGELACNWSIRFRSIIGYGEASFVESLEDKERGLQAIMKNCTGREDFTFPKDSLIGLGIIKVEIVSLTGKQANF